MRPKAWVTDWLFRCGGADLYAALARRRLGRPVCILSGHRVIDEYRVESEADRQDLARGCLTLSDFSERVRYLRARYRPAALDEYVQCLSRGVAPPPKLIVFTFDDGFRDVYAHAFPVMLKEGVPFSVFLTSGFVGRRPGMLSVADVREMAARGRGLVTWGAHGVTHRPLTELSLADAEEEIIRSKKETEDLVGAAVDVFCYPDGKYDERIRALLVKRGFKAACATGRRLNVGPVDRFALQRIPFESEPLARFAFRVAGLT